MFDPHREGGDVLLKDVCGMQVVVSSFEKMIRRKTWKRTS
jgi:hypothetical protein